MLPPPTRTSELTADKKCHRDFDASAARSYGRENSTSEASLKGSPGKAPSAKTTSSIEEKQGERLYGHGVSHPNAPTLNIKLYPANLIQAPGPC